jgi:hypothetical protein
MGSLRRRLWLEEEVRWDVAETQRLKALEDDNCQLKLLVAELSLHGEALLFTGLVTVCCAQRNGCIRTHHAVIALQFSPYTESHCYSEFEAASRYFFWSKSIVRVVPMPD